jgi:hypothetical protein
MGRAIQKIEKESRRKRTYARCGKEADDPLGAVYHGDAHTIARFDAVLFLHGSAQRVNLLLNLAFSALNKNWPFFVSMNCSF